MKKEILTKAEIKKAISERPDVSPKDAIKEFKGKINIPKVNPIMAYIEKFDLYFKKKKRLLQK